MDDYKQPDTPETAEEVEMLLDQQAVKTEPENADPTKNLAELDETQAVEPTPNQAELDETQAVEPTPNQAELDETQAVEPAESQPEQVETEDDKATENQLEAAKPEATEAIENQAEQVEPESDKATENQAEQSEGEITALTDHESEPSEPNAPEISQEAKKEASQPESQSEFHQSVTLDAIQDPESVKIVNKAKQLLADLDEAQKDKTRLTGELKQSEKAYSSMEKSVAEGITIALKKKKEEIAATYDRELSQYQDQIDACKTERAKAKANAIAQRIQVETAPLNQQNQQLEAQIELKFKENKVPVVCKKRAISMLFFPKNGQDWIVDSLVGIGLMFFVPLLFTLSISNRFVLAFTFFLYVGVLFAAYLYLLHKFMLKYAGVNEEVEELRKQIRVNNKNKQLMTNRIKKSQDETGYNLGGFDDKIAGIQQVMQDTVAKRQEALENFESEIRHQITADITAANKDELLGLQQDFESKRQELADKKEQIAEIEKQLKEEYEPVFGKDLLYKQRLNKFDSFCQENADLSLDEALTQYRALSGGSKLLKK